MLSTLSTTGELLTLISKVLSSTPTSGEESEGVITPLLQYGLNNSHLLRVLHLIADYNEGHSSANYGARQTEATALTDQQREQWNAIRQARAATADAATVSSPSGGETSDTPSNPAAVMNDAEQGQASSPASNDDQGKCKHVYV